MDKSSSPLDTLRQLRELLDAGTITPQEFETLKSRLLATPTVPLNPTFTTTEPVAPPVAPTATGTDQAQPVVDSSKAAPLPTTSPEFGAVHPTAPLTPPTAPVESQAAPESDTELETVYADDSEERAASPLGKILAIGGGLLLLGLILYLVMGQSRSSEHLTSISQTAADTVATTPETGPQAEQIDLPPAAAPETVRVAPVIPATPIDSGAVAAANRTTDTSQPPADPASTAASENEATDRVHDVLAAYCADIQAAPFNASQYFAPQVELFVILRNTTPAAINSWLSQNRFAEFKDAKIQVEPGTLRVSPPAADGSRVATYIEQASAFRQSLQKNQMVRAQMRVRFNPDYKIVYQKQERLLENTLTDVESPQPQE